MPGSGPTLLTSTVRHPIIALELENMRKRVLVIDDEPSMGHVFRCVLRDYEVRAVTDPTVAIEAAKEFRPDVFLLDLIMPGISGDVLARNIRREPCLCEVPIIFISAVVHGRDQDGEPVWIGQFPAFGKPFSIEALKRCIARQVGNDLNA
jgi:CheY-like chemotaxis protein